MPLSMCLFLFFCVSDSVCLWVFFVSLFVCVNDCLFVCILVSVSVFVCSSVRLSEYVCVCVFVSLFLTPCTFVSDCVFVSVCSCHPCSCESDSVSLCLFLSVCSRV